MSGSAVQWINHRLRAAVLDHGIAHFGQKTVFWKVVRHHIADQGLDLQVFRAGHVAWLFLRDEHLSQVRA